MVDSASFRAETGSLVSSRALGAQAQAPAPPRVHRTPTPPERTQEVLVGPDPQLCAPKYPSDFHLLLSWGREMWVAHLGSFASRLSQSFVRAACTCVSCWEILGIFRRPLSPLRENREAYCTRSKELETFGASLPSPCIWKRPKSASPGAQQNPKPGN